MILWQDLTFWTAVGQIGLGAFVGLLLGAAVRRARRLTRPRPTPTAGRICPACGTASLRRARGTLTQKIAWLFARRWPYVCQRCEWPQVRPTPAPRVRPVVKRGPTLGPRPVAAPAPASAPDIETTLRPEPEPEPVTARDDVAQVKDAVFRYLALLNAGDVGARANCQLSDFTSFGMDGKPLHSNVLEWRRAGASNAQTYDLRCRDLRVYIHKDTAIATAYLVGTISTPDGELTRVAGRSSWVHLRQNGEWKMAHNHMSPLTPEV